ncbi:MAG: nucleotidyltransferase family protein [Pseudomonadota bacterium]|nr:nucleotidyltransferase family protein [Pseudomonadota bacterium]
MKALILAAGLGERMRPLTERTPKPLLQAGGKPLIVWHLEKLAAAGVRDVVINTSWLAGQFPQTLGDGAQWGLSIGYSYEGTTPLETGGGMLHALPLLGEDAFIVVNGDIWTDYDFIRLPREPAGLAHVVVLPLPAFRTAGPFENALADVLAGHAGSHTLAGIGVYRPQLLDGLAPGRFSIVPRLTQAIEEKQLSAEILTGTWRDIGTPQRLEQLDGELNSRSGAMPRL